MDWERGSHGNTYGGESISLAQPALATIEINSKNEYLRQCRRRSGQYTIEGRLRKSKRAIRASADPCAASALMIGVEFGQMTAKSKRAGPKQLADRVVELAV